MEEIEASRLQANGAAPLFGRDAGGPHSLQRDADGDGRGPGPGQDRRDRPDRGDVQQHGNDDRLRPDRGGGAPGHGRRRHGDRRYTRSHSGRPHPRFRADLPRPGGQLPDPHPQRRRQQRQGRPRSLQQRRLRQPDLHQHHRSHQPLLLAAQRQLQKRRSDHADPAPLRQLHPGAAERGDRFLGQPEQSGQRRPGAADPWPR